MAYLRMSPANAIFMTLLSVSYVMGVTDTVAECTNNSLADVAHMDRLGLEIRSSDPEWYREGMLMFAYRKLRFYWKKRHITWALTRPSTVLPDSTVIAGMKAGFAKWAEVSSLTFQQVSPSDKPDIEVVFVPVGESDYDSCVEHARNYSCKDVHGVTIQYTNTPKFRGASPTGKANFDFFALYEIGHALGLGDTVYTSSIMNGVTNPASVSPDDPKLAQDDIAGIQEKYGPPTWRPVPPTPRPIPPTSQPVPSSSSSSSNSSSSSSTSSTTSTSSQNSDSSSSDSEPTPRARAPGAQNSDCSSSATEPTPRARARGYYHKTTDGYPTPYRRSGGTSNFRLWGNYHL